MEEFHIWYFWWLIFPIMGFAMGALKNWLRYRRQRDAVELLKAYAVNGREPPPEVLAALRVEEGAGRYGDRGGFHGSWFGGLVMLAFAGAFAFATTLPRFADNQGLRFVVAIFLALGIALILGQFIALAIERRSQGRLPPPDGGRDA